MPTGMSWYVDEGTSFCGRLSTATYALNAPPTALPTPLPAAFIRTPLCAHFTGLKFTRQKFVVRA